MNQQSASATITAIAPGGSRVDFASTSKEEYAYKIQWTMQVCIAGLTIAELWMTSTNGGWARGGDCDRGDNELLNTADGGHSWSRVMPGGLDPYSSGTAFVLDDHHAWMIGSAASNAANAGETGTLTLLRIADAGRTWTASQSLPLYVARLTFADPDHGWSWITQGARRDETLRLRRTEDGGATWAVVQSLAMPTSLPLDCAEDLYFRFTDMQTGWAGGPCVHYDLYGTHDGGVTWHLQALTPPKTMLANAFQTCRQCYVDVPDFHSPRDGIVWIHTISDVSRNSTVYATHDGGATWICVCTPHDLTAQPYPISGHQGWMRQSSSGTEKSTDGISWSRLEAAPGNVALSGGDPTARQISWVSPSVMYANSDDNGGGDYGVILRSGDAGQTWSGVSVGYAT